MFECCGLHIHNQTYCIKALNAFNSLTISETKKMNRIRKCAQNTSFVHSKDILALKYFLETRCKGLRALEGVG
jgi:hypothetical protein